ncbi:unnamed protein product [Moneuplotes crassus]|uniref:Tubulin beta chain n=1 Tax=Euplotes crassus TaxID=5936 RepID=A0AAD1U669_EUPCR|nr:unnamed protein product [Moneuplotes crassus]
MSMKFIPKDVYEVLEEICIVFIYSRGSDLRFERIETYFSEIEGGKYVPRTVLVDMEPSALNSIKFGSLGILFKPDNIVSENTSTGNSFAKGHYSEGAEMVDSILEVIREEVEGCDSLQSFQLSHSIRGGTGSGLGTLVALKL